MTCFPIMRRLVNLAVSLLTPLLFFAQDSVKTNVELHQESSDAWYNNSVVWLIGAAVFTFLLVLVLRGNRKPGKVSTADDTASDV